ncbi:hypothetical protein IQ266_00530 [filamentous cyanobacterium LEGE 11480]|uniref:Secreted protein n=1 Tax=Romeriopsis navalis LEGE 11480 TaxID=2777977 RepID=A0A928VLV9_9CYAN|nr:hypothetical protein [Romeriopsis navalis]MBE9028239.1 hypothetical protein [Romeriopsis navalis LEGE 11480]
MKTTLISAVSGLVVVLNVTAWGPVAVAQPGNATNNFTVTVKSIEFGRPLRSTKSAQSLMTQPMSLDRLFRRKAVPMDQANLIGDAIPTASNLVPKPINPVEVLQDPGGALERFFNQTPIEPKQLEPLEFFEIPGRDTGVKMDVFNF